MNCYATLICCAISEATSLAFGSGIFAPLGDEFTQGPRRFAPWPKSFQQAEKYLLPWKSFFPKQKDICSLGLFSR
jgi:hypothetical protein